MEAPQRPRQGIAEVPDDDRDGEAVRRPREPGVRALDPRRDARGVRRAPQEEIIWLEWSDLDLDEGWLHIRAKRGWSPKTNASERSIPITGELLRYLKGPRRCDRWVAPFTPGAQWNRRHLGINVRRLFKAAEIDDGGPHTLHRLRGTFATEVLRSSGDLRSLQAMLGHGNLAVTSIYLSEVDEHKRSAVRGLGWQRG